jgi:hypothetical protein
MAQNYTVIKRYSSALPCGGVPGAPFALRFHQNEDAYALYSKGQEIPLVARKREEVLKWGDRAPQVWRFLACTWQRRWPHPKSVTINRSR